MQLLHYLRIIFDKLFTADKWNIGIINQSIDSLIDQQQLDEIYWLKEDKVDYAADPFIVADGECFKIYYEELNFWKGNGEIMVLNGFDFETKRKVEGILPVSIHLSYPYLIQSEGFLYCIPETSEAKEVALYKVDNANAHQLTKQKVLLSGLPFVDSSIVFYNNKYWLFTSVTGVQGQLYVYHSSRIDGDYQAHQQNPITVNREACRGAGALFISKGILYRPTQNPTNCYGGAIQINRIKLLTESHYETEPVFEILPASKYAQGIHNISFANGKIVVDGKRKVFEVTMPLKKLTRKLRK